MKGISFRVHPDGVYSFYFVVHVWDRKKGMRAATAQFGKRHEAICMAFRKVRHKNGRKVWSKQIGEIHFWKGQIVTRIIVHEFTHAALAWARFKHLDFGAMAHAEDKWASQDEERLVEATGVMVRQFVDVCHSLGYYT